MNKIERMRKLILFVFIIFILILITILNGCIETEEGTETPTGLPETEIEMISNLSCDGNAVTLTLTNIGDSTWTIAENVIFYVNNFRDESPGCDKTMLQPGETTICASLDAASLGLSPSIIVVSPAGKEILKVRCE